MKLLELDIRRLPGIDPGFGFRPAPDAATVVTGPNGSGKSSLGRALKALLYPEAADGLCDLGARLADAEGSELEVRRLGADSTWLRDGTPATAPDLPAADYLGLFLIRADDLAAAGATESRLTDRLRTLLAGGFDLDGLLASEPFRTPSRPSGLSRELAELEREVEAREQAYAELAGELEQIDELEARFREAVDAQTRFGRCEQAIALCNARREEAAVQVALSEFPAGMDRLNGNELERLEDLDQRLATKRQQLLARQRQLAEARETLAATGIEDPDAMAVLRDHLVDCRGRLAEKEERLAELERSEQNQQAALAEARRRAGGEVDNPPENLDPARLDELDAQVDQVRSLREKLEFTRHQHTRLKARGADGSRIEPLAAGCRALRRWLRQPEPSRPEFSLWVLLLLLGITGSATVLSLGFQLPTVLLMLISVLVPAGRLVTLVQRWQLAQAARATYPNERIEPPLGWTWPEVEARLGELEQELAEVRQASEEQARFESLGEEMHRLKHEHKVAGEELETRASALGLSAELRLSSGFLLWNRAILDWRQAGLRLAETRRHQGELRNELKALAGEAREALEATGQSLSGELDSRGLGRLLNQLNHAISEAGSALNAVEQGERRISELEDDLVELGRARLRLYRDAGIEIEDSAESAAPDEDREAARAELRRRLERLDRFARLRKLEARLALQIARDRESIAADDALATLAEADDLEALNRLRESLSETAGQRDALNTRMAELRQQHRDVIERRELEDLNQKLQSARERLAEAAEDHLLSASGSFLLERVRDTHRSRNQPAVLTRAGEWFARFTRDQYGLEFDGERFGAMDRRLGRRRGLEELSSGTRVQMLIALRLAWIDEAERGRERLPLFLDEVLATSDPDRYRAMVETVQELVRDGRQVIYLSAQPADAEAWRQFAGKPKPLHVDMATLRSGQVEPDQAGFDFSLSRPREIPAPGRMDAAQWAGKAGVVAVDPWADPGRLDVFHLLRDELDAVAALRRNGLDCLGPVESWLKRGAAGDVLDPGMVEALSARARAARCWLKLWRRGRSRPVTEAELVESGAVSDRFLGSVSELLKEVNGDPEALLAGLRERRVNRFLARNIDRLEEYFEAGGFVDSRESLPAAEMIASMSERSGLDHEQARQLRDWLEAGIRRP